MANSMFSSRGKDATPKSIEDCKRQDSMTENLWTWAENLEKIGAVLVVLVILAGVSTSLSNATEPYVTESGHYSDDFNFSAFFVTLFTYVLYSIIVYCSYHVLALLIGSLARIVQSTKTTAKIAELQAINGVNNSSNAAAGNAETATVNDSWSSTIPTDSWICSCGCRNKIASNFCKSCGKKREQK